VAKPETMPGCDLFDPIQIRSAHHEIHVAREHGVSRICLFDVDENGQTADQFVGDARIREGPRDFVHNADEVKQPFLEQGIYRLSTICGILQKLCKRKHVYRRLYRCATPRSTDAERV